MAHYFDNDSVLKDGDMILNDSGMKLHAYCSDITTTFPVNGKFTEKQRLAIYIILKLNLFREIYNLVLKANRSV